VVATFSVVRKQEPEKQLLLLYLFFNYYMKLQIPGQRRAIRALVLTPTRELAIQIDESFRAYGQELKLKQAVVFGGVSQNPQVNVLRAGVDILIATPGRLLDLIQQHIISLSQIEMFVLDEADRMLDMDSFMM
jgi:ATP-dependent RNA helicase RhlE